MPVEMTIALLLLHTLPRPYQTILMASIALARSTLLSLCCTWSTRHATVLTQSDFRVSQGGAGTHTQPLLSSQGAPMRVTIVYRGSSPMVMECEVVWPAFEALRWAGAGLVSGEGRWGMGDGEWML